MGTWTCLKYSLMTAILQSTRRAARTTANYNQRAPGHLPANRLTATIPSMSDSILDQLTRTATEHGRTAFWLEALPWIVATCGAIGGQILIDLTSPTRRAHGRIDPALQHVIEEWETELVMLEDWLPVDGGSLARTPTVEAVVAHDELPIVHITIYEGRSVTGGLSLVYETGALPGSNVVNTASALIQSLALMAKLTSERYQLQRRLTQGNLLYEVSRAISSSLEIDDVLNFTTALATNALGAEASALLLVDQKAGELVFAIVHGSIAVSLRGQRMALADDISMHVIRTGQPLIVNDVANQAVFGPLQDGFGALVVRNVLCAPLQVKGEILGVLQVLNREGDYGFSAEDLEWLMALAGQASVAIENARLYSTLPRGAGPHRSGRGGGAPSPGAQPARQCSPVAGVVGDEHRGGAQAGPDATPHAGA